jgi:hypothetical protein
MKTLSGRALAMLMLSAPVLAGADAKCSGTPPGAASGGTAGAGSAGCEAQAAESEGPCLLGLGYKWDGQRCVTLGGCRCVGPDCGELFGSEEACASAHAQCAPGARCSREIRAVSDFVQANKTCQSDADCQSAFVGCGYTEDGCTGAVYVNQSTSLEDLAELARELYACDHGGDACSACYRAIAPATCVAGSCRRTTP